MHWVSAIQKKRLINQIWFKMTFRHKFTSSQARSTFINYFVKNHSHKHIPSCSALASTNSTLLFTIAGMNQFAPLFLENFNNISDNFKHLKRAVNSQKCIRISGKHNDFDDVGNDGYHHTFFEMLGNWSFGDYFKKEACSMAWNLLTGPFQVPAERLYVTYFGGDLTCGLEADLDCREMWLELGVPAERILPFGMKENFWEMGESGPCGPCTEIHYSHLPLNQSAASLVNSGNSSVIELWNLVFMQYYKNTKGELKKLQRQHVDTGMGLERLTAVLNGKLSNYDTDLFLPIFKQIQKICGCPTYNGKFGSEDTSLIDTAYRILADHTRMAAVCIADGLVPEEIGAGHCLRRAIRRAAFTSLIHLNYKTPLMSRLIPTVADILGENYPNISSSLNQIVEVVSEEEDKFQSNINHGIKLFEKLSSRCYSNNVFSVEYMWDLYSIHGLQEEFIVNLVRSKGLTPPLEQFRQLVAQGKLKTREAYREHLKAKEKEQVDVNYLVNAKIPLTVDAFKYTVELNSGNQMFVPDVTSCIVGIWDGTKFVKEISHSDDILAIMTKETNFYSEAGGQMADVGFIANEAAKFEVINAVNVCGYVIHYGKLKSGKLSENSMVNLAVDYNRREGCMRSHTATHLLNSLLRKVIDKTEQRSSAVDKDHLKLSFTSEKPLSNETLEQIESRMKELIMKDIPVKRQTMAFIDAKNMPGFVDITGESYPSSVTVIDISLDNEQISLEPCCGTHLLNTRDMVDFVITTQKSVGQHVKSITAVVGPKALQSRTAAIEAEETLKSIARQVESTERFSLDLFSLHQQLSKTRIFINENSVSIGIRKQMEGKIDELQKEIIRLTRIKIHAELNQKIPQFENERAVVYLFEASGPEQVIFSEAIKAYHNKPCFWFVKCGSRIFGRCVVPQKNISSNFNAEIWSSVLVDKWSALKAPSHKSKSAEYKVSMESSQCDEIIKSVIDFTNKIYI